MHPIPWILAGLLLTRLPFVEAAAPLSAAPVAALPPLRVSENHRFLVTADGQPFWWLADTAWWILQLPPSQARPSTIANRSG